jgi:P pilus assembly chaperone PapD
MLKKSMFRQLLITTTLGLVCVLFCLQSWANVSISSRRINVDYEQGTTNFIVTSRQATSQECNISLTHNSFDEAGHMSHYTGKDLPPYAADDLIRYSPKTFELPANRKQTVRFTLRRKPNTPAMEHRAYVVLACSGKVFDQPTAADNNAPRFTIQPILKHSIPLIVRPQKLQVAVNFDNIRIENNTLSFDLNRLGERSVYGNVEVINKDNNEIISTSASLVMYIETTSKSFNMVLPQSIQTEDLVLRFKEDANFGGDLDVTWSGGINL